MEILIVFSWRKAISNLFMCLLGSLCGSAGRESVCNAGNLDSIPPGLIPGSGRSTGEGIGYPLRYSWAFLVVQLVKNPAMWETWVQSLGWGDPWRREMLPTPVLWPREFHNAISFQICQSGCYQKDNK